VTTHPLIGMSGCCRCPEGAISDTEIGASPARSRTVAVALACGAVRSPLEVQMAAPSAAGPPWLRLMRPLELDEHPTHAVRDHLLALGATALFCLLAVILKTLT
jgi:hypothetical protein